jgi:beta-lactamase class D
MIFRIWRSRSVIFAILGCLIFFLLISFREIHVFAQQPTPTSADSEHSATVIVQAPDLGRNFRKLGVEGSIVIYDLNKNKTYEHNPQRNQTAMFPGSTFKIFNAMVALETGTIPDDVTVLTWDGIQREVPEWNRNTNLRQGFKDSTVWFYQVLARRIGHKRMQQFIDQVGYGNRQIGTAKDIDHFWLEGPLQITAKQQIEFLQKLYRSDLPFSARTMNLVKDMMVREQTPDYTWRGKTGWLTSTNPELGWFVGYLEQNKNVYFFATNININKPEDAPLRIEVTRRCFKDLGLL